ncbi:MAG: alpha-hydroxy acid oxidase [Nitrososphaerales archaeon]
MKREVSPNSETKEPVSLRQCIADYESEARNHLSQENINYVYRGTESEATLRRNVAAYAKYLIRRRVLQGIVKVDLTASYFEGRIKSELPFFPGPVNLGPLFLGALRYELKIAERFSIPLFISHLSIVPPLEVSKLPALIRRKTGSSLIWQIYVEQKNLDSVFKQAERAERWGYDALTLTVDGELSVKLGNDVQVALTASNFVGITSREIKKLRKVSSLPLIVKGVMTGEDAELAIESGADGVVVSNHGGRTLDFGQATIEALPEVVKCLKSKKRTRRANIFVDGGIRRGTDILKALALGAEGCMLGRAILWSISTDPENGPTNAINILKGELERAALLSGTSKISKIRSSILARAD